MSTRQPRTNIVRVNAVAAAAWDAVARGEDSVSSEDIGNLLKALGMKANKREQAVAIRQFQVSWGNVPQIKRKQFIDWYVTQKANFAGAQLNRLLVKDQLGKSRTTSYELPGDNFTYGVKTTWSAESAGDVALNWKAGSLSKTGQGKRNIIAENKACVQAGMCSVKGWQEARESNKRFEKYRTGQRASRQTNPYGNQNLCYGKISDASPAVSKVMQVAEKRENYNYPDLSGKIIPGKIPLPRPTRSSSLLADRRKNLSTNAKQPFKLKKFKKIGAKINSNNRIV
jgi:hypothetical protein